MQEQSPNETVQKILNCAERLGLILDKDSTQLLEQNENWEDILTQLAKEGNFLINPNLLEKKLNRTKLSSVIETVEVRKASFIAQAKDRAPNFRVMEEYDVTGKSNSNGKVDDFLKLFRSKYELLSNMLKARHNLNPIPLKNLAGTADKEKVDVIGMVNKKWITKKGHTAFELEDLDSKCIALVMEKEKVLIEKAERVIEDNVIGVKGTKWGKDFIIIKEFFWPDMPINAAKTINEEVYIGGISDLHIGSNLFFEEQFCKLLDYLNGKDLTPKQQERVGKIQYLFVTGDNVAGIGVYPNQFDELIIKDVYGQYEKFEDLMLQIPEYINVFICTPQGTLVKTINGYKPVEELKENDKIFSYDEEKQKVVINKITKLLNRNAPKLIKLNFVGGAELICTPEHPLVIHQDNKLVWKTASELKKGVLLPIVQAYNTKQKLRTIDLLKKIKEETYIKNPQIILERCKIKKSLMYLPERTRLSYFSGKAPVPVSLLVKTKNFSEKSFAWPIEVKTHSGNYLTLPKNLSPDFLYFVGLLLTDGSFSKIINKFPDGRKGFSYRIRIFNSNKILIDTVKSCLKKFGLQPTEEYSELPKIRTIGNRKVNFKKTIYNISYTNRLLGDLLISLGIIPGSKKKSSLGILSILGWNYIKYLLAGLFDGDGTRDKKRVQIVSSSKKFALETFLLLQEHGFAPNLHSGETIHTVTIHRNSDVARFFEQVPLKRINKDIPKMNKKISDGKLNKSYGKIINLPKSIALWRKLEEIKEIEGNKVYNFEVENTHTYIAMGFINHNCPGQHDAVRRAEPQPAIDKEFVPRLSKLRNFHFISSPSWVETEGLKNLIYHGPSVHDLISSVSFLSMTKPEEAMIELLKKRDLMPKYGGKNPYVPEGKAYMVIKEEPDLVWFGDMHHKGYATYRGTSIINSGCWEGQTDFQKKMGHVPTVCTFPMINLKNRQITEIHFSKETVERDIEDNDKK